MAFTEGCGGFAQGTVSVHAMVSFPGSLLSLNVCMLMTSSVLTMTGGWGFCLRRRWHFRDTRSSSIMALQNDRCARRQKAARLGLDGFYHAVHASSLKLTLCFNNSTTRGHNLYPCFIIIYARGAHTEKTINYRILIWKIHIYSQTNYKKQILRWIRQLFLIKLKNLGKIYKIKTCLKRFPFSSL